MVRQISIAITEILGKCGRLQSITVNKAGSAADVVIFGAREIINIAQGLSGRRPDGQLLWPG